MLARILNTLLMLAVAVSITGVINRTRAVLAGRKGLRFFQHLFDAKVLLGKGGGLLADDGHPVPSGAVRMSGFVAGGVSVHSGGRSRSVAVVRRRRG